MAQIKKLQQHSTLAFGLVLSQPTLPAPLVTDWIHSRKYRTNIIANRRAKSPLL